MKYVPLFTLYVSHKYYADGRCPDFLVAPAPETRRLLANHRCIAKPLSNGVQVLAAANHDGTLFIPQAKGMLFAFQLILLNPNFLLFTDLSEDGGPATRLYSNRGSSTTAPQRRVRTSKRIAPTLPVPLLPTPRQVPETLRQPSNVFADVEISYDAPANSLGPTTFQLEFSARVVWWKYYLVTNPGSAAFRIQDQDKDGPLSFKGPIDLSSTAMTLDPVATSLAAQYPGMRLQSFLSTRAVTCQQQPRRSLQLFTGDNLALGGLPNPSMRNYAIDRAPGGAPGKGYLFQVLKYVTHVGASSGG